VQTKRIWDNAASLSDNPAELSDSSSISYSEVGGEVELALGVEPAGEVE